MSTESSLQSVKPSPRVVELSKLFNGRSEIMKFGHDGWTFFKAMENHIEDYSKFEFEDTDVIVHTYPKSGTTWTQELVWTMKNNPDLDNPLAETPLNIRTPCVESDSVVHDFVSKQPEMLDELYAHFPDHDKSCGIFLYIAKQSPRPRTIKCHLPFSLLSPTALEKGKVVCVIRDPRDVCISFYHHCRLFALENFTGTFDQFIDAFMEGAVLLAPYWAHIRQAWSRRDHPNMHIIFYESLKKDTKKEIVKLNDFLATNLTDQQIEKVVHHASFEEMKKRGHHCVAAEEAPNFLDMNLFKKEGGFFRKGQAGGWRNVLTQQQKDKFEAWIKTNCPDKEIMDNIMSC